MVKLLAYNTAEEDLGRRALSAGQPRAEGAWMGLSEITAHGDWVYIDRARQPDCRQGRGQEAVPACRLADMVPAELGGALPVVTKELVRDLMPDLAALNGYVVDKIEGFAIDAAGNRLCSSPTTTASTTARARRCFWSIGAVN